MCAAELLLTEDPVPAATGEQPCQQDPHFPHTTAHRQLQPTQPSCKKAEFGLSSKAPPPCSRNPPRNQLPVPQWRGV